MTENQRIRDLHPAERPRERLGSRGPDALTDAELLAVLLGSGTKGTDVLELASRVQQAAEEDLRKLDIERLTSIRGIGPAKACQIVAAFELARRWMGLGTPPIRTAADVLPYIQHIRDKRQEYFVCLSLSGANEVIENRVVTVGLLDSSQVHPREVFADPIADRAASIILAHNHPSGVLEASAEDIALTRRLAQAGKLLGIPVLDHVIVAQEGYVSMKQTGVL